MNILTRFTDDRGDLYPLNFSDLPFKPKRFFLISNAPKNKIRGNHAHYKTKQYLICLKGEIEVFIHDGKKEEKIILNEMDEIYIPNKCWDYQVFKTGEDILAVFASTEYDKNDYINCFEKFIKEFK